MPARAPAATPDVATRLSALGERIRAQRKVLGVSATSAVQAAGMSRVTWHRIESGEPSVTVGACMNALAVLALDLHICAPAAPRADTREGAIPPHIRIDDYPQLRRISWQVHGTDELTPAEALGLYERNRRHLDPATMQPHEQRLIDALRSAAAGVV